MSLILRSVKGSRLTTAEMDANLSGLADGSLITALPNLINSVQGYGASTSASAATNTTAFNAALAAHSVVFVPGGPGDVYDLNALAVLTAGKIIYGNAMLRFNTTSDCIDFNISSSPPQSARFMVKGLRFDNLTNVPSSFIRSRGVSVNGLIDECQFSECAATYCVDNYIGYGLKVRNSVFSDVTGSAIRFQDSLNQADGYSFVASVDGCDISGVSVDGIVIEGAQVLGISNTVVEGCAGKGIVSKALTNQTQAWNIHLNNVYFELNTGTDLDLSDCSASYWSEAVLTACVFVGTPTIALGVKSKVTIVGSYNGGSSVCTVSGSTDAAAILIGCANFIKSGTFMWTELDAITNSTDTVSYTPSWTAASVNPAIGDGTLTGKYTRIGNRVDVNIHLLIGASTTTGTGKWFFTLPSNPSSANHQGLAYMFDSGNSDWTGIVYATTGGIVQVGMTSGGTTNNGNGRVAAAVPFAWGAADTLDINISYWV